MDWQDSSQSLMFFTGIPGCHFVTEYPQIDFVATRCIQRWQWKISHDFRVTQRWGFAVALCDYPSFHITWYLPAVQKHTELRPKLYEIMRDRQNSARRSKQQIAESLKSTKIHQDPGTSKLGISGHLALRSRNLLNPQHCQASQGLQATQKS